MTDYVVLLKCLSLESFVLIFRHPLVPSLVLPHHPQQWRDQWVSSDLLLLFLCKGH